MNRYSPRFAHRLPARLPAMAFVTMALMLFAALFVAGAAQNPVDLRKNHGHLPWRFRTVATAAKGLARERGWITHELHVDADGDGIDDKFRASDHGVCGTLSAPAGGGRDWQTNLPVEFVHKGPCASIDVVWDLDGDGRAEVACTAGTPDGFHWRLDVLDAASGARKWHVELPSGSDDRGDGNWDGFFRALGPFTANLAEGAHPALLVGIEAGYDERPRGVIALDGRDGHELWRYLTGPKPTAGNFRIVDLDGDGRQEICLLGAGVSNLEEGEGVNGFRDDHARLFVLGDDGALRWERALGQAPASGWLEVVDLDRDGRSELVVTAFLPEMGREALAVLDGSGAVLASHELPGPCHSLTVAPRAGGATAWLTFDGSALRYELARGAITPGAAAEFEGPAQVALVADVVGDAEPELLLGTGGRTWLVDERWQPLALFDSTDYLAREGAAALRALPAGERRLVLMGDPAHDSGEFVVEENPRPVPWAWIVAGLAGAGTAGATWRWRRDKLTREAIKALRLQLLERLVGENHGEIGPLSTAERLADRLLGSFTDVRGDRAPFAQRIRDLLRDMLDDGVPQLAAAADLAEAAGLDDKVLEEARRALAELQAMLAKIASDWDDATPTDEAVTASAAALRVLVKSVEQRYRRLCKLVEVDFTASPGAILARSLAAREDAMARLGVEVSLPGEPVPDCFIDAEDLAFVLDNLVENALRAMEPVAQRRLAVDWRPVTDVIAIHVQDTGVGMTAAEAVAALEPGEGKRAGGGRGLPGSRARLRKYEGKLIVATTAPGEGTTMVLYLRYASKGAASTAPEGSA